MISIIKKYEPKGNPDYAHWKLAEDKIEFQFMLKKIGGNWCVTSFMGGKNGDNKFSVVWLNKKNKAKWRIQGAGKRNSAKSKEEMLDFIDRCEKWLFDEYQIVFLG